MGRMCMGTYNIYHRVFCWENGVTMHQLIQVSEEVYNRLKPRTNNFGGRSPRKKAKSAAMIIDKDLRERYGN